MNASSHCRTILSALLLAVAIFPAARVAAETKITYALYNYEKNEPLVCNIGVLNPQTRGYDFIGKIRGGETITLPPEFVGKQLQFTIARSDGRGGVIKRHSLQIRDWNHYTIKADMVNWRAIDRLGRTPQSSRGSSTSTTPAPRPACSHCGGKGWILYEEGKRISGNQYRVTKREKHDCPLCN